eukprot:221443-Amorphochlora_amoeboformis.AAC.1
MVTGPKYLGKPVRRSGQWTGPTSGHGDVIRLSRTACWARLSPFEVSASRSMPFLPSLYKLRLGLGL